MEPLRILHVVTTMDFGGVETLLMSIYRNIDRTKIQFDFLCHNRTESAFSEEIRLLGGRMYKIDGVKHVGLMKYIKSLRSFFSQHREYQIVHSHINSNNGITIWQAAKEGVKHRISHSHIANAKWEFPYSIYMAMGRYLGNRYSTDRFACSKEAGDDLFSGKKFQIITNAIQTDKFIFDIHKRNLIRKELAIYENSVVFGHVGRFVDQKNHQLLLQIFCEINKMYSNCKLLLLGAGPLFEQAHVQADELGITDSVIFGGQHSDLSGYYSAMDAFLFPSLYEGLGIVAVEAQCSGLPVIASDMVPAEAKVTDRMQFLSLKDSPAEWAKRCVLAAEACRDGREACYDIVAKSHYNISTTARFLQDYYLSLE